MLVKKLKRIVLPFGLKQYWGLKPDRAGVHGNGRKLLLKEVYLARGSA